MGTLDEILRIFQPRDKQAGPAFTDLSTGNFDHEVVGESFYQPQIEQAAREIEPSPNGRRITRVKLLREPRNPYDENAVKVVDMAGRQFGHLPREQAEELNEGLAELEQQGKPVSCRAVLVGGGKRHWGVWLDFNDGAIDRVFWL